MKPETPKARQAPPVMSRELRVFRSESRHLIPLFIRAIRFYQIMEERVSDPLYMYSPRDILPVCNRHTKFIKYPENRSSGVFFGRSQRYSGHVQRLLFLFF